jgi:hypothetical protein
LKTTSKYQTEADEKKVSQPKPGYAVPATNSQQIQHTRQLDRHIPDAATTGHHSPARFTKPVKTGGKPVGLPKSPGCGFG